jgi:hypothetical protein
LKKLLFQPFPAWACLFEDENRRNFISMLDNQNVPLYTANHTAKHGGGG